MKWNPHNYQKESVKFMLSHPESGLFLSPGSGKTSIILHYLKILKSKKRMSTLVVAPFRVMNVWCEEIEKWGLPFTFTILHGSTKDEQIKKVYDVYITNYDSLEWLAKQGNKFDILVLDESSKIKHHGTKRWKTLKKLLNNFSRRHILTGSPAAQSLLNLFTQVYTLDGGVALGRYITHYKNEFFYPAGYGGYEWKPIPGAEEKIFKRIEHLVLRFQNKLDLPPCHKVYHKIELPDDVKKLYYKMERELYFQYEEKEVVAANAAVASNKLRQIVGGNVYGEKGEAIAFHNIKAEMVKDLVEEMQGQPCLVGYEFTHDRDALLKALGPETPYIDGTVSSTKADYILKNFNSGNCPVLLGNTTSLAYGLNLQAGKAIIFYSIPWSLEIRDQFVQRIWRQGQKDTTFIHYIIAKSSIDEAILNKLECKDKAQNLLFSALEEVFKKYVTK